MSNQVKSKHLINEIDNSVQDALLGLVSYNDNIVLVQDCDSVVRKDFKNYVNEGKVILICGGIFLKSFLSFENLLFYFRWCWT